MGRITDPVVRYTFETRFFRNGVYSPWYSTSATTTNYLNQYGYTTTTSGCRL